MSDAIAPAPVATSAAPLAPGRAPRRDLRIVLFGRTHAGKTSLLGALRQAAEKQESLLRGKLIDPSGRLLELRERVYDTHMLRTADEVVPYPVVYEAFTHSPGKGAVGAVLVDCDGRVAHDLLVHRQELAPESPEGSLAREVLSADTLVLVIDAAAPHAEVEQDFASFEEFLGLLQQGRAERTEVAGLPVFLVLTKCDLLVQPGDTREEWAERVAQRKRDVEAHFRSYRERRAAGDHPPGTAPHFGRIDLQVAATAVKYPPLADSPARPREPYGVAEQFRQWLAAAEAFQAGKRRSNRRLALTVVGVVALLLALAGGGLVLTLLNLGGKTDALRGRIEALRLLDDSAADRLRGEPRDLATRQKSWQEIHDDPLFGELSPALQEVVVDRLEEVKTYRAYWEALRRTLRAGEVRSAEGLEALVERLEKELAPRKGWAETEAGKEHAALLAEAKALQAAVAEVVGWYREQQAAAERLWVFRGFRDTPEQWTRWASEAKEQLGPAGTQLPFAPHQVIPNTTTPLTYEKALGMPDVQKAREGWEEATRRLRRVRDLTAALGLITVEGRPPLLVLRDVRTVTAARDRLAELRHEYPDHAQVFEPGVMSEAMEPAIRRVAKEQYQTLLEPGRAEVAEKLKRSGGARKASAWQAVERWLHRPGTLDGYRDLLTMLARLIDPKAADPVKVLADFLEKESFQIAPRTVTLEIPDRLGLRPLAGGELWVLHSASKREPGLKFIPLAGQRRFLSDRAIWTATYQLKGPGITYRPGDELWGTVRVQVGLRGEKRLTWITPREVRYQFEALHRPPRLGSPDAANPQEGTPEPSIRLIFDPPTAVPAIPDLMPARL